MSTNTIDTAEQVPDLAPGQWVIDADGDALCLVDTHMGFPQRMWMHKGARAYSAIDRATYPLSLADLKPDQPACPHPRIQECGHCKRCGQVVAEPRPLYFDMPGLSG